MGTERSRVFEIACKCGSGTVTVDHCAPDHGWPTTTPEWYEKHLNCDACRKLYTLELRSNSLIYISKEELKHREELRLQYKETLNEFNSLAAVMDAKVGFAALLNAQGSVAAIYRLLTKMNYERCAIGTFRKHWRSAQHWVDNHVNERNIVEIFKSLDRDTEELDSWLYSLNELNIAISAPCAAVGPVIVSLTAL